MLFVKNFYKANIQKELPLRPTFHKGGAARTTITTKVVLDPLHLKAKEQTPPEKKESMLTAGNLVALGTFLFSLITFFATPLFNSPLLDYKVGGPYSTNFTGVYYIRIDMTNTGI